MLVGEVSQNQGTDNGSGTDRAKGASSHHGGEAQVSCVGSGLGAFLGGLLYDVRGTYDVALGSNVVLLSVVTVLVFLIRERIPASGQQALAH